jgi:hypothetical protein
MKVAEETRVEVDEQVDNYQELVNEPPKTFEVPGWILIVENITRVIGLCIGVVLAFPFVVISRAIEWYQTHKNKEEK